MRIAIVDCETTGLDIQDVPISIAAVVVALDRHGLGVIVDEWYGEQEPTVPISDSAYAVHGRTLASLAGKSFDLEELSRTVAGCTIAIAHHAIFDAGMIAKAWHGIAALEWRCSYGQWPFPRTEGGSLDAVCLFFGIQRHTPHHALADAKALLRALNRQDEDSGVTYLSTLLDREVYAGAGVAARRTVAEAQQTPVAQTSPENENVEFIAIAIHSRKLILSPAKDLSTPVIAIDWYDADSLNACENGTSFPLNLYPNLIVALHNGKSILHARGQDHDWLVKLLTAGEKVSVTILEKGRSFIDFAVWKRSPDVAPVSSTTLDPEKPLFEIAWFDNSTLMRSDVGTVFELGLQSADTICGLLDGEVTLRGDARINANQWIVQQLQQGIKVTAVIASKDNGFVDFTIRKQVTGS